MNTWYLTSYHFLSLIDRQVSQFSCYYVQTSKFPLVESIFMVERTFFYKWNKKRHKSSWPFAKEQRKFKRQLHGFRCLSICFLLMPRIYEKNGAIFIWSGCCVPVYIRSYTDMTVALRIKAKFFAQLVLFLHKRQSRLSIPRVCEQTKSCHTSNSYG